MSLKYITCIDILNKMNSKTEKDIKLIIYACEFAKQKHKGQKRYSGEPYYTHVFQVGKILAEMSMSAVVVAAGILHDTLEDTDATLEEINKKFNNEIGFLVDGVSHLGEVRYHGLDVRVKSLQKLFVATSKDLRVIIIKLADRLHNMQTINAVPKEKQKRIAKETLKVYVPIADRLGMSRIKGQLEELSFSVSNKKEYEKIKKKIDNLVGLTSINKIEKDILRILVKKGIMNVSVYSRIKNAYSTYRKMNWKKYHFEEVKDILAFRVLVDDIPMAYTALGAIHLEWSPLPHTFKDYISFPKPNGYRALHTRVLVNSIILEIQILTYEMQQYAEYGVASHFNFKEKRYGTAGLTLDLFKKLLPLEKKQKNISWLEKLSNVYSNGNEDFIGDMENDFLHERMFIYTPKGDVVDLPINSTVIDFAFSIHTDIGLHAEAGSVNHKYSSLNTKLKNGDVVKVHTNKKSKPTQKWLDWVVTAEARAKITSFIKKNS